MTCGQRAWSSVSWRHPACATAGCRTASTCPQSCASPGPLAELRELAAAYARVPAGAPGRRMAVVGNAPIEPSAAAGREIDGCDLVIRVNSFVLDAADGAAHAGPSRRRGAVEPAGEGDAGRCSTATATGSTCCSSRCACTAAREVWPASWPSDLGFVTARNDEVAIPLNEELGLPWRAERLAPTTGTTAVWLAVRLFPDAEVLLTGLSFVDAPDQVEWDHQWGDSVRVGPEHRIAAEAALLRRWRDEGRVRVIR